MKRFALPAVLCVLALALFATAVRGVFTIDEHSYISTIAGLRDGTFRLSATEGLPVSPELLSFDAAPRSRRITEVPAAPNTPPLYAVVALPFSYLGVPGLIALQVIAFVLCAWLVFRVVRRETGRTDLAWFGLATYVAASFALEYAQAMWPHATTMALVMLGVELVSQLRHGARHGVLLAALAGLAVGFAAGMRYQNIAIVGTLAVSLAWVPRRKRAIAGYLLGAAIPLFACAAINASRLGTWNPVSKGWTYLDVGRKRTQVETVEQAFTSTWARVVDFNAWQPATGESPATMSGQFRMLTGVKRALLQSAPWAALALVVMFAAWRRRRDPDDPRPLAWRGFSIIVAGVLGVFALYGFRSDGLCFNQRYLLELMPILAASLAIVLADWEPRWRVFAAGAVAGLAIPALLLVDEEAIGPQIVMMKLPLAIAAALVATWFVRARFRAAAVAFSALLGASLGWALAVHVLDDVPATRLLRAHNAHLLGEFVAAVPDDGTPIAAITFWGVKDKYGPLLLERDIVIVDPWIDDARDANMMLDALLAKGRTVYIDRHMPTELLQALARGRRVEGGKLPWLVRIRP